MLKPTLLYLTISAIFSLSAPALAQEAKNGRSSYDVEKNVKDLGKEGQLAYQAGNFILALEQYRAAYLLRPEPLLLFNIAQCQRQLGQFEDAVQMYQRVAGHLRAQSEIDAEMLAQIEATIAELEAILSERAVKARIKAELAPKPTNPLLAPVLLAGAGAVFGGSALILNIRVNNAGPLGPEASLAQTRIGLGLAAASDLSFVAALGLTAWTLLRNKPKERVAIAPALRPGQAAMSLQISIP